MDQGRENGVEDVEYRMSLAAVIVVVVDDKALASSPAGGAGVSSEPVGRPSEMHRPRLLGPLR